MANALGQLLLMALALLFILVFIFDKTIYEKRRKEQKEKLNKALGSIAAKKGYRFENETIKAKKNGYELTYKQELVFRNNIGSMRGPKRRVIAHVFYIKVDRPYRSWFNASGHTSKDSIPSWTTNEKFRKLLKSLNNADIAFFKSKNCRVGIIETNFPGSNELGIMLYLRNYAPNTLSGYLEFNFTDPSLNAKNPADYLPPCGDGLGALDPDRAGYADELGTFIDKGFVLIEKLADAREKYGE